MKGTILLLLLFMSVAAFSQATDEGPCSIRGRVIDNRGDPVVGASIHAAYLGFRWAGRLDATSGADGNFVLAVPKPETYVLTFSKPRSNLISTYSRFHYVGDEFRPEVVVDDKKPPPQVVLRFPQEPGTLKIEITDAASGRPVKTAQIRLCRSEAQKYCYTALANMSTLPAISESFSVEVNGNGYDDWYARVPGVPSGSEKELKIALIHSTPTANERDRLPAPAPITPLDGTDFGAGPPDAIKLARYTKLEWAAVPGAASYSVEVEFCDGIKSREEGCKNPHSLQFPNWPPASGIDRTSYEFNFIGSQPGRWRVWATDADGRPGLRSPWNTFFYHQ